MQTPKLESVKASFRVMLVEDDLQQLELVSSALKSQENQLIIDTFSDFESAQKQLETTLPDLLISDIILGAHFDGGFELARQLQSHQQPIPIIFFSERQSEFDILAGHDLGAVDYLPKPISLSVLQKKVHNLLSLFAGRNEPDSQTQVRSHIPQLELDSQNLKAYWHGQPLNLTVTEFEMIEQFAQTKPNAVISYQQLQAATQGVVERNTINTHVCRIRQAFKQVKPEFDAIQNVYGRGYCWHEHD